MHVTTLRVYIFMVNWCATWQQCIKRDRGKGRRGGGGGPARVWGSDSKMHNVALNNCAAHQNMLLYITRSIENKLYFFIRIWHTEDFLLLLKI